MGHESDLFALTIDDDLGDDVRPFSDPAATARRRHDLPLRAAVADDRRVRRARLAAACCSTTTSRRRAYFAPYDPALFRLASLGRQELATLVGRVDLALGDSEYNRRELEALGFAPTGVFPIAVDTARITQPVRRPALEEILDDGLVNFLFVGRIAPNKKIEDHIRLAEALQALRRRLLPLHLRRALRRGAAVLFDDSRADGRVPTAATIASSSPARSPTRSSPSTTGTRRSTSR